MKGKSAAMCCNAECVCMSGFLAGSRRASDGTDEFEVGADKAGVMTDEEKEYLRWYYRIEDREY